MKSLELFNIMMEKTIDKTLSPKEVGLWTKKDARAQRIIQASTRQQI